MEDKQNVFNVSWRTNRLVDEVPSCTLFEIDLRVFQNGRACTSDCVEPWDRIALWSIWGRGREKAENAILLLFLGYSLQVMWNFSKTYLLLSWIITFKNYEIKLLEIFLVEGKWRHNSHSPPWRNGTFFLFACTESWEIFNLADILWCTVLHSSLFFILIVWKDVRELR